MPGNGKISWLSLSSLARAINLSFFALYRYVPIALMDLRSCLFLLSLFLLSFKHELLYRKTFLGFMRMRRSPFYNACFSSHICV